MLSVTVQPSRHHDLAPILAETIDEAYRAHSDFWSNLVPPLDEEDEAIGNDAVRRLGLFFAPILASMGRLLDDQTIDLYGRPFPPPPQIVAAIRSLQDSYTLLINIQSYEDIRAKPLVPCDNIRAKLSAPESREWMMSALAAYETP